MRLSLIPFLIRLTYLLLYYCSGTIRKIKPYVKQVNAFFERILEGELIYPVAFSSLS